MNDIELHKIALELVKAEIGNSDRPSDRQNAIELYEEYLNKVYQLSEMASQGKLGK